MHIATPNVPRNRGVELATQRELKKTPAVVPALWALALTADQDQDAPISPRMVLSALLSIWRMRSADTPY